MELQDNSSDVKITEIDTIFVNSQVLTPFCILWSKDNKILVNVEEGVFVFELWPTPLSEKPSITFLKSWIPSSESTPLSNAVVENENGSFLWSLDMKQAYEAVIDSTLSSSLQRSNFCGVLSYFVHCEFSPLIGNRSYLTCLTNTGVLEIYKDQLKKWVPVINVTDLWILYCNFKAESNEIDFNTFKSRMFQLKIITMKWVEEPEIKFITGHENGTIVFWQVNANNDNFDICVQHILSVDEKPECIQSTSDCNNFLIIIGFRSGIVKCFSVDLVTGEIKMQLTLWENKDAIVPKIVFTKTLFNKLFIFTIKRHIILVQNILIDTNQLELLMTKWEEFSTAVTGWHEFQGVFMVNLQNHDMYALAIKEDKDKKFMLDIKAVLIEIKERQKTSYGSFGLAMSQNKIFWILVSSAKVNYDSPKGITYLTIYSPKLKIFKSLTDSTSSGLIDKILEKYKGVQLNEIFDLLELKKLELLKGISKFSESYKIDKDLSLLSLQMMLWEVKLKFSCNLIETELPVTEIEYCIIKTCTKKVVEDLEQFDSLSSVQKRSLAVCQMFLRDNRNRSTNFLDVALVYCPAMWCRMLFADSVTRWHCFASKMKSLKLAHGRKHCKVTSCEGVVDSQSHSCDNYEKFRIKRNKANARERNRMLGLNKALDRLRSHLPIKVFCPSLSGHQKLSKIETLKIACNYIRILTYILKSNRTMGLHYFIRALTAGLSHSTARIIASSLGFLSFLRD